MAVTGFDPGWLAALQAGSAHPPLRPRLPLLAGATVIGSVEPDVMHQIAALPLSGGHGLLSITEHMGAAAWSIDGEPGAGLHALALALRELGLAHVWRDEQLAVTDPAGRQVGTVERAVVRVLGIATQAVHLVGRAVDGRYWVQQRSLSKANDPGLWDTMMGGMVGAADTLASALERETWEEAGLRLNELKDLTRGGALEIRRPCDDGGGTGYLIERMAWYRCTVPDGLEPVNQDGEVERFVLMDPSDMLERMHKHEFTREAALIQAKLLRALSGHSLADLGPAVVQVEPGHQAHTHHQQ